MIESLDEVLEKAVKLGTFKKDSGSESIQKPSNKSTNSRSGRMVNSAAGKKAKTLKTCGIEETLMQLYRRLML